MTLKESTHFEEWLPVVNGIPSLFLGMYEVSNLGRVRRTKDGSFCIDQQASYNYTYVEFIRSNERLRVQTQRIVALHFIPNPNNYNCVLKHDLDRFNNAAYNLYWGTIGDAHAAYRKENFVIRQYNLENILVGEYDTLGQASMASGAHKQAISNCYNSRKNFKTAGGYIWKKVYKS